MFNFEIENNNIKFIHTFYYTMHFIKEIIKHTTVVFFLCLGITQIQNKTTPVILLENSEITNRKNEFYAIEKNALKLFAINTTNQYNKIWEYKFSDEKDFETINVLYGDISGNGEKEVIVLNHTTGFYSSLYVFQTNNNIPIGPPEIFQLKSGSNKTKPIEAKLLRWDADKDKEIIVSFGSPERKIIIIDFIIDSIKIVDNIAKDFLLNSYGPINLRVFDSNNDKIDDIYIYSNSAKLEKYTHISNQDTEEQDARSMADKKISSFLVYKDKKETREIALINNSKIYVFDNNTEIPLLSKVEKIYHLKNDRFALIQEPLSIRILSVDLEKNTTKDLHIIKTGKGRKTEHIISEKKNQILFYNQENKQINLVELIEPYNTYSADPQQTQTEPPLDTQNPKKHPKKEETKKKNIEKQDTLIVNAQDSIEILIPRIPGYIFQDLETTKKPKGVVLSLEKLSFIWVPTNTEAGYHPLEYRASYNSEPKLEENKINNQLIISAKSEEKKIKEKKVFYVNGLPQLIINTTQDTVPVNSEFEAKYNIEDPNENDQHSVKVANQKTTNPLIIHNNSLFWKPQKQDAGINIFNLEINDGKTSIIHPFRIFVDTTMKENIYTEKLNATTNTEFVFQLPHTKGNKYELVKKPENLRTTKKGKIYWIPLITQIDSNMIEILITNKLDVNKYNLEVYVNSPPIISYRPAIEENLKYGETLSFVCQSFDMNQEAKVIWELTTEKTNSLAISDYGEITLTNTSQIDNIIYEIVLSDQIDRDHFEGIFYINTPPEFNSTPNEYIALGDTFIYKLEATDKNKEKPFSIEPNKLFYKIIYGAQGSIINEKNTLIWTPKEENLGENNFLIEVTDSLASNTQEFIVFVNDKPSITSIDSLSIELGDTLKHLFYVKDLNQNSEFSYNIKTTLDEILFSRKTGTLTWIPSENDIGLHNLEISVSDGFNQSADTQKLKIYVYKLPELLNSPMPEAFVNVEYIFEPAARDMYNKGIPNTDIFIEFNNPDTLLSINYDKNTNILSWIPSLNEIGKHPFTLDIIDKDRHILTEQFDIQVILSPCENTDTLFNNNIDTIYHTIIDSVFIKQTDTLTINKTDTISQIQIDSIYIEKRDTIKILIDASGFGTGKTTNIPHNKSAFDRNNTTK